MWQMDWFIDSFGKPCPEDQQESNNLHQKEGNILQEERAANENKDDTNNLEEQKNE